MKVTVESAQLPWLPPNKLWKGRITAVGFSETENKFDPGKKLVEVVIETDDNWLEKQETIRVLCNNRFSPKSKLFNIYGSVTDHNPEKGEEIDLDTLVDRQIRFVCEDLKDDGGQIIGSKVVQTVGGWED